MIVRKRTENSRYSAYLDAFDFTGLVEQKLKDSEAKCLFLRQWTHFTMGKIYFCFYSYGSYSIASYHY